MQTANTLSEDQHSFLTLCFPTPLSADGVDPLEASYHDTTPLRTALGRLCDSGRINDGNICASVGAVDVRIDNLKTFDNTERRLRAKHFMASGALSPDFPPVLVDGEYYWGGDVLSNAPLSYVLGSKPRRDMLVFQVDLWSALDPIPNMMIGVTSRQKDLQHSSRIRLITD